MLPTRLSSQGSIEVSNSGELPHLSSATVALLHNFLSRPHQHNHSKVTLSPTQLIVMADVAVPAFKKRTNKSSNIRKRPATPPPEDSDSGSDYTDDEAGVRIKRRKKEGVKILGNGVKASQDLSKSTKYEADRSRNIAANDDATKTSNWYAETDTAAEAAKASARSQNEAKEDASGAYKGSANYSNFIQRMLMRRIGKSVP